MAILIARQASIHIACCYVDADVPWRQRLWADFQLYELGPRMKIANVRLSTGCTQGSIAYSERKERGSLCQLLKETQVYINGRHR